MEVDEPAIPIPSFHTSLAAPRRPLTLSQSAIRVIRTNGRKLGAVDLAAGADPYPWSSGPAVNTVPLAPPSLSRHIFSCSK
eukprot:scaffold219806_cov33-Tisochrysis_lutea.AAC.2